MENSGGIVDRTSPTLKSANKMLHPQNSHNCTNVSFFFFK